VRRQADGAGVRPHQAGEHLDGGGFAGSVGAEQADERSGGERKAKAVQNPSAPEGLGETVDLQDEGSPDPG